MSTSIKGILFKIKIKKYKKGFNETFSISKTLLLNNKHCREFEYYSHVELKTTQNNLFIYF